MFRNPFRRKESRIPGIDVPRGLTVEITSHCMYDCGPCPLNFYTEDVKRRHLDLDRLETRLKELPPLETIDLTGWGESFLHPGFERAVSLATSAASDVSITTTGLFLDQGRSRILIDQGVSYVMISLDAASRDAYRALKHKDDFEKVVSNIEAFLSERSRLGRSRPRLAISCILMRETLPEWNAIAALAGALKADQLVFKSLVPMSGGELKSSLHHRFYAEVEAPALDPAEELDRAVQTATKAGVEAAIFNDWDGGALHPCMAYGEQRPYLKADGMLAPCCMLAYPLERPLRDGGSVRSAPLLFGNWFDEPLETLWKKPEYAVFREQLAAKNPGTACRDCPVNHIFRLTVHAPGPAAG